MEEVTSAVGDAAISISEACLHEFLSVVYGKKQPNLQLLVADAH
jgi:hypothetical protein